MNAPAVERISGAPNLLLGAFDVGAVGYAAQEFFVSGTATSYGRRVHRGLHDAHRRPDADGPGRFSGTVIVEWLNVSGGIDAPALWFMAHREIIRAGHAYVAVSAQRVGVEGGANLVGFDMSLKTQDPVRYGALHHPGDAYAYDIYSQIGSLVRDRADELLGDLQPEAVVAVGESQSALYLTTYVNTVDPQAKVYDGFLIHSRFGLAAPLDGESIFEASGEPDGRAVDPGVARARPDGHHRDRPARRSPGGLSPGQAARLGSAVHVGARGNRARRQLHDQGRLHRLRFGAAGRPRRRIRTDHHLDGPGVVVLHQLRPAAPLRAAVGARPPRRLDPHG